MEFLGKHIINRKKREEEFDNGLWKVSPNIQYLLELFVISSNNQIMYKLLLVSFINKIGWFYFRRKNFK